MSLLTILTLPRYLVIYRRGSVEDLLSIYFNYFADGVSSRSLVALALKICVGVLALSLLKKMWDLSVAPLKLLVFWLIANVAGWTLWVLTRNESPLLGAVLFLFLTFGTHYILSFLFMKAKYPAWKPQKFWEMIWICPFWQYDIPGWDSRPLSVIAPRGDVDQFAIFKNILKMIVTFAGLTIFEHFLFSVRGLHLQNYMLRGYTIFQLEHNSSLISWVDLLLEPVHFVVFDLYVRMGMFVLALNAVGYSMPLPVQNPLAATSFANAFSKIFVYYGQIVVTIFYIPISQRLRRFEWTKKKRGFVALFSAVYLMSMIYHMCRDCWFFIFPDVGLSALEYCANFSIYSALLALAICLSVAFENGKRVNLFLHSIRLVGYWITYSGLLIFSNALREPLSLKIRFLLSLFGQAKLGLR